MFISVLPIILVWTDYKVGSDFPLIVTKFVFLYNSLLPLNLSVVSISLSEQASWQHLGLCLILGRLSGLNFSLVFLYFSYYLPLCVFKREEDNWLWTVSEL